MSEQVCFSILRWPVDVERGDREIAVRAALGVDQFQARRIVMGGAPTVARLMPDGPEVPAAIKMLAKLDAVAFAPRRAQIEALPEPLRAKSLEPAVGAPRPMYAVEPWRGAGGVLIMDEVVLLIRGLIKRTQTRVTPPPDADSTDLDLGLDLGLGLVSRLTRASNVSTSSGFGALGAPVNTPQHRQIIDLYRSDGTRVRIDADKFSFGVLGKSRGLSDGSNTDMLALRLAEEATRAIVDTGFAAFRPAAEVAVTSKRRAEAGGGSLIQTDRTGLFDFYSRWLFLGTRHLAALPV